MQIVNLSLDEMRDKMWEEAQNRTLDEYAEFLTQLYVFNDRVEFERMVRNSNSSDLKKGLSASLEPVKLWDGVIIDKFEILVNTRFTYNGHTYLSNGTHALSHSKTLEDMLVIRQELTGASPDQ